MEFAGADALLAAQPTTHSRYTEIDFCMSPPT